MILSRRWILRESRGHRFIDIREKVFKCADCRLSRRFDWGWTGPVLPQTPQPFESANDASQTSFFSVTSKSLFPEVREFRAQNPPLEVSGLPETPDLWG
jgi:hypothetical protein